MYRLLLEKGRLFRVVAACCALFYIVAACRAMVPELCATQRAALAAAEEQPAPGRHALNAVSACCAIPWSGGSTAPVPADQADPSCAFCNLAKGFSETLAPFRSQLAAALPHARPGEPRSPVLDTAFAKTPPGRAPPLQRSA